MTRRALLADARRVLGIEHLVLMIHDASFPSRADEDTGRGSPYSRGAWDLVEWAQDLGFTGVQFGPQGETSAGNPSPYDGTIFAKTVLSLALWPLAHEAEWEGVLSPQLLEEIVLGAPAARGAGGSARVDYSYVWQAHRRALREIHGRMTRGGPLWRRFESFRLEQAWWLDRDARYESLASRYGTDDWTRWPLDDASAFDAAPDEVFELGQFLVHAQHAKLVARAKSAGMDLFGDLQIGVSHRDRFARGALFVPGYLMGAPPSRTNPDGQPWGYPVALPDDATSLAFLRARADKLFTEFDALRIDHPHGLVCPWVYRADEPDALRAVQRGARLRESPDLPEHPELARWSIARPEQIDHRAARHADGWVTDLDDEQVDAYARQLDVLVSAARARGRSREVLLLEVLSTSPYPLDRVRRRYGLGRFRVTQKADPRNRSDVYSTFEARRGDWVMLGNHDTPPIWAVSAEWTKDSRAHAWCDYLEARLGTSAALRASVRADTTALAEPMLADLLACDAGRVAIFFADLLGMTESYNRPGVVSPENWTLRTGNGFRETYEQRRARGRALDVPRALAMALRARGGDLATTLATQLETLA